MLVKITKVDLTVCGTESRTCVAFCWRVLWLVFQDFVCVVGSKEKNFKLAKVLYVS